VSKAPRGLPYDSDEFLAAIIDSSSDAILSKDLEGRITSWNKGAERMFGYTAAEVIGKPVTMLFPPERYDEEPKILERIRRGEAVEHYQTVRRRKDGALIDISLMVSPIRNGAAEVIGASKIARDVTEQREATERFRVTLASIGDAVISTDTGSRITFMNEVAERLTGWPSDEAHGRSLDDVFHIVDEETRQPVASPVVAALEADGPVRLARHTLLISRRGVEHPIDDSAAPIRNTVGGLAGAVIVFRDIESRREAEIVANRLAAIVAGSDDAIVSKDLNGIVTSWNPGAQKIFGYTENEMIGQSILRLIPPERQQEEPLIIARFQRGERVDHFETVRVTKDGRYIDVSLTISPIFDDEGRVVGASKIARDITVLRAAQTTLERYARELEERVKERTAELQSTIGELEAFSYSMSHDLRAPLRSIRGFAEVVMEDYADRLGDGAQYVGRIQVAAKRMDQLIRNVLAFARLSHDASELDQVDIDALARQILVERPEFHAPDAEVTIEGTLPAVLGHEAPLTQVITNLLDNAVKFVAQGVTPRVILRGERRGDRVRIAVSDNGIGIDESGQAKLFELFQRAATAERYQGTGIGLAIVRKAVERMHGTFGLESEVGKGSAFWFELGAAPQ
jgi:PAS domain S-box-containing protein